MLKGKSKDIVIQMSKGGERQTDFLAEKAAKKSLPPIFGTPFSYLYGNTLRLGCKRMKKEHKLAMFLLFFKVENSPLCGEFQKGEAFK